jgi:hypothetical protein
MAEECLPMFTGGDGDERRRFSATTHKKDR